MSAIQMTCPKCGALYIAGVVGSWSFPAHVCPKPMPGTDPYSSSEDPGKPAAHRDHARANPQNEKAGGVL